MSFLVAAETTLIPGGGPQERRGAERTRKESEEEKKKKNLTTNTRKIKELLELLHGRGYMPRRINSKAPILVEASSVEDSRNCRCLENDRLAQS